MEVLKRNSNGPNRRVHTASFADAFERIELLPNVECGLPLERIDYVPRGWLSVRALPRYVLRLFLMFLKADQSAFFDSPVWKERGNIRRMYNIKGTGSNDFWISWCCLGEAVIQHRNEIMIRQANPPISVNQTAGYVPQPGMCMPTSN